MTMTFHKETLFSLVFVWSLLPIDVLAQTQSDLSITLTDDTPVSAAEGIFNFRATVHNLGPDVVGLVSGNIGEKISNLEFIEVIGEPPTLCDINEPGGPDQFVAFCVGQNMAPGDSFSVLATARVLDTTIGINDNILGSAFSGENTDPNSGNNSLTIPLEHSPIFCDGRTRESYPSIIEHLTLNEGYLVGTPDEDLILGNIKNDVIFGMGGNDCIYGRAGDDVIAGQQGNDEIHGGSGDDVLLGNKGNDKIFGEVGKDRILGGEGDDFISGGPDHDIIFGRGGADTIRGDEGNDVVHGNTGNDIIEGNSGNDVLIGGLDDDTITGGEGQDFCDSVIGNDLIDCETTVTQGAEM